MTLGSHQKTIGGSQVAITPVHIIYETTVPFGRAYDLDPCGNDPRPWSCARTTYTINDDGLSRSWFGRVWLNPPFHRYQVGAWIKRLAEHGCGMALLHARTETDWFRVIWESATALRFLYDRLYFHQPNGDYIRVGSGEKANSGAPAVLCSFGQFDCEVLADCAIPGFFNPLRFPRGVLVMALEGRTWREVVGAFLKASRGPVTVGEVWIALRDHAKARGRKFAREQIRKVLQEGAGRRVGPDQWVAA